MARGTFANIRLKNKLVGREGPKTIHIPSGEEVLSFVLYLIFFILSLGYWLRDIQSKRINKIQAS